MWGRKQKRIEELEDQLADTLANLVHVTVPMPPNVGQTIAGCRKGIWHRVSYMFMVTTEQTTPVTDVFVEEVEPRSSYFDGATYVTEAHGWVGGIKGD
jgi:phenylpyruvate tautomerase PptA (4-oxalocrotonate tautomerase family)